MKRIIFIIMVLSLNVGCSTLKETGKKIGHTTRDVTRDIGHATRDVAKSVTKTIKDN